MIQLINLSGAVYHMVHKEKMHLYNKLVSRRVQVYLQPFKSFIISIMIFFLTWLHEKLISFFSKNSHIPQVVLSVDKCLFYSKNHIDIVLGLIYHSKIIVRPLK